MTGDCNDLALLMMSTLAVVCPFLHFPRRHFLHSSYLCLYSSCYSGCVSERCADRRALGEMAPAAAQEQRATGTDAETETVYKPVKRRAACDGCSMLASPCLSCLPESSPRIIIAPTS